MAISSKFIRMSLKKYLLYSFVTVWTMVLILALVAAIVHQVSFQKSSDRLQLERSVASLESQTIQLTHTVNKQQREIFRILNTPYYE